MSASAIPVVEHLPLDSLKSLCSEHRSEINSKLRVCRAVLVVQGAELVLGDVSGICICQGAGAAGVCVWAGCESSRPTAHGGRQHMPYLSGEL